MTLKEILDSWVTDIISSALGVALIGFAYSIKAENSYYWIALFAGIIFQIPLVYFKIWQCIKGD